MAIKLVSFADGAYSHRLQGFKSQAQDIGVFDDIIVETCESLPVGFTALHKSYMQSTPRGFGYWIWKPVIIFRALKQARSDDVIMYLDSGFTVNVGGKSRLLEYIEIAGSSPDRMLSFQIPQVEKCWTKADLFDRLGVQDASHITLTGQLASGCILLKKTQSNLDLLERWCELAVEDDYHFSDDSHSLAQNCADFVEHRHDQSISSILRKARGTATTYYEAKPMDKFFTTHQHALPLWATRSKE